MILNPESLFWGHDGALSHDPFEDWEPTPDLDFDPRISAMPLFVRRAVLETFLGDVEEARFQALRFVSTHANPPSWARWLSSNPSI